MSVRRADHKVNSKIFKAGRISPYLSFSGKHLSIRTLVYPSPAKLQSVPTMYTMHDYLEYACASVFIELPSENVFFYNVLAQILFH